MLVGNAVTKADRATRLKTVEVATRIDDVVRDRGPYSARNSSKGALIDEAGRVFTAMASGNSLEAVRDQVFRGTLLAQRSRENRERIWSSIHQRYLVPNAAWLTSRLTEAIQSGPHCPEFVSLLYLLYALRDRLTFDFVTTVLCFKAPGPRPVVTRNDVLDLIRQAADAQPHVERWSENTRVKLAGSILTALRDFGLLEGQQKKVLVRPPMPLSTAEALLRVLIAEGLRGRQIMEDSAWRLFLLSEADVAATLAKLAQQGTIRFERAGATVVLETPRAWEM
jgi:hypothetical protein